LLTSKPLFLAARTNLTSATRPVELLYLRRELLTMIFEVLHNSFVDHCKLFGDASPKRLQQ